MTATVSSIKGGKPGVFGLIAAYVIVLSMCSATAYGIDYAGIIVRLAPAEAISQNGRVQATCLTTGEVVPWSTGFLRSANKSGDWWSFEFRDIPGWTRPEAFGARMRYGEVQEFTCTYVANGAIEVTISPAEAVTDGAKWRLTSGPDTSWKSSAVAVSGLSPGAFTVEFYDVSGWTTPVASQVTVAAGQTTRQTNTYVALPGCVQVTISPAEAVSDGARWRLTSGPDTTWKTSAETVTGLATGAYTVVFLRIGGWVENGQEVAVVRRNAVTSLVGRYLVESPHSLEGNVVYMGGQRGPVKAGAKNVVTGTSMPLVTASSSQYMLQNLSGSQSYAITAFCDVNGNGMRDAAEPFGQAPQLSYTPTQDLHDVNIYLLDPVPILASTSETASTPRVVFDAASGGDGCVYIGGRLRQTTGETAAFILKTTQDLSGSAGEVLLNGNGDDEIRAITCTPSGDVIVVGDTKSTDLPTTPGAFRTAKTGTDRDVFIFRYDHSLSNVLAGTYLGQSGYEAAYGVAVGKGGDPFVIGETTSADFPTTLGAHDRSHNGTTDVFVVRMSADLSTLIDSTFIGGSSADVPFSIMVQDDNVYVAGATQSTNFPTSPGAFGTTSAGGWDGFVCQMSTNLTMIASTLIGGGGNDIPYKMLLLDSNILLAGETTSTNIGGFSGSHGIYDGFVAKVTTNLSTVLMVRFIGGSDYDSIFDMYAEDGDVILGGDTYSRDFVLVGTTYSNLVSPTCDFFITRLDGTLTNATWSLHFGGNTNDYLYRLVGVGRHAAMALGNTCWSLDRATNHPMSVFMYNMRTHAPLVPAGWMGRFDLPGDGTLEEVDTDGDGVLTVDEYPADTDPTDALSLLAVTGIQATPAGLRINWQGGAAAWQYLERKKDLLSTNDQWQAIFSNPPPTLLVTNVIDVGATNASLYYRIKAVR